MAVHHQPTTNTGFVACACDDELRKEFEAEMERNGQTYADREEEEVTLVRNAEQVDNAENLAASGCLLCGYSWRQIKWTNVLLLLTLHGLSGWALTHSMFSPVKLQSTVWTVFTSIFSGFGMSVGAHRLWAHRGFKARPLLRFVLLVLQTMTLNGSVFSYARDHRNHHKWPATHADPSKFQSLIVEVNLFTSS